MRRHAPPCTTMHYATPRPPDVQPLRAVGAVHGDALVRHSVQGVAAVQDDLQGGDGLAKLVEPPAGGVHCAGDREEAWGSRRGSMGCCRAACSQAAACVQSGSGVRTAACTAPACRHPRFPHPPASGRGDQRSQKASGRRVGVLSSHTTSSSRRLESAGALQRGAGGRGQGENEPRAQRMAPGSQPAAITAAALLLLLLLLQVTLLVSATLATPARTGSPSTAPWALPRWPQRTRRTSF